MSDGADIYADYFGHTRASQPANEFEKLTVDYLYGTLYARAFDSSLPARLDLRDRALVNVAVCAALGRAAELRQHVDAALHQGLCHNQLVEVMVHLAHYAGWPAGHSGMKVLEEANDARAASSHEEVLREVNQNIAEWEQLRSPASIEQLDQALSSRLLFHRANGTVVTKSQFMRDLDGESPFRQRVSEGVSVAVVGTRACASVTVVTTNKDNETSRYRNLRVFAFEGGRWQLEFWFNYELHS